MSNPSTNGHRCFAVTEAFVGGQHSNESHTGLHHNSNNNNGITTVKWNTSDNSVCRTEPILDFVFFFFFFSQTGTSRSFHCRKHFLSGSWLETKLRALFFVLSRDYRRHVLSMVKLFSIFVNETETAGCFLLTRTVFHREMKRRSASLFRFISLVSRTFLSTRTRSM